MRALQLEGLTAGYGRTIAVRGVDLVVPAGKTVVLLGANGAGKSTLLKAAAGLLCPVHGAVWLHGERVDHLPEHARVDRGLCLLPDVSQGIFRQLTVRENLELGAYHGRARARAKQNLDRVHSLFPRLLERKSQLAGSLSGGEQQMCAIGRGLMARPRLLLLDEPSLGLAPVMVRLIFENLKRINESGTTILLVEQNVARALALAHRAYVLENGRIVLDGPREALQQSPHVKQAYLGL